MDKSFDAKRREEFKEVLQDLAKADSFLEDSAKRREFYLKLEHIYYINAQERFRHFYSDIFSLLVEINTDTSLEKGDIDVLGDNLSFLVSRYKAMNTDDEGVLIDISESLWKLYDHVSLDIARIRYSNSGDDRLSHELEFTIVSDKLDEYENRITELANETTALKESLSKAQLDYIAILGIFASIVLAFVGGLAFSTSVLDNINSVSVYRLLIVALIIGVVFITIIFLMFHYIGVLSGRNKEKEDPHIPLLTAYLFFGILILAVVAAWNEGWIEERNSKYEIQSPDSIEAPVETNGIEGTLQFQITKTTPEE